MCITHKKMAFLSALYAVTHTLPPLTHAQPQAGSTACVALLVDGMLHVANVGDSRAVLCDTGEACALTHDHKPETNARERARLTDAGAAVTTDGYIELRGGDGEATGGF